MAEKMKSRKSVTQRRVINFNISKIDQQQIKQIIERVRSTGLLFDSESLTMDLVATHLNGTPLDLSGLYEAPDFSFFHDIFGIQKNINRKTGKLDNCFLPRYVKKEARHG